jgi:hypothetical protein
MARSTLEQRVAALESRVAELLGARAEPGSARGRCAASEGDTPPEDAFRALAERWRRERGPTSSPSEMVMKPAYLRIVGLGKPAVPLLLRELRERPDHWFVALAAITGEDPVAPEHRGDLRKMADDWLIWGRQHAYIGIDAV